MKKSCFIALGCLTVALVLNLPQSSKVQPPLADAAAKQQGFIPCSTNQPAAVGEDGISFYDCDRDGKVDGILGPVGRETVILDSQDAANQQRFLQLDALRKAGRFTTRCQGKTDLGVMTADKTGYPFVLVCGQLVPTPGHFAWTEWLGRDSKSGQILQRKFEEAKHYPGGGKQ